MYKGPSFFTYKHIYISDDGNSGKKIGNLATSRVNFATYNGCYIPIQNCLYIYKQQLGKEIDKA